MHMQGLSRISEVEFLKDRMGFASCFSVPFCHICCYFSKHVTCFDTSWKSIASEALKILTSHQVIEKDNLQQQELSLLLSAENHPYKCGNLFGFFSQYQKLGGYYPGLEVSEFPYQWDQVIMVTLANTQFCRWL